MNTANSLVTLNIVFQATITNKNIRRYTLNYNKRVGLGSNIDKTASLFMGFKQQFF